MKKTLFAVLALSLFLFAVSAFSVPQVGAEKGLSEGSLFVETEIDSRYNGQIVAAGLLEAEGKTITISASDTAVTGLHLEGKGNTVRITGERVTLENCSLAGAEAVVTGKGFFAVRCDFDDLTFAAEAADAEAARCVIEGAVSLYGRNQVLYGNRCGAVEADGAANLSVVKNEGESVTVRNASFVNLSGNSWKKEVSFDDRAALWGSDLAGLLEGTEYTGADPSRLPQNDKTRFETNTVREKVYTGGAFVSPNECVASAATSPDEELVVPAGIYSGVDPLVFNDCSDFTLAAYGVFTRFKNYTSSAVQICRCDRIAVEGLTVDHMKAANAQGTVLSVGENSIVWEADAGYGFDLSDTSLFSPLGVGLAFRAGEKLPYRDCYGLEYLKNEDGTFTVNKVTGLSVGDRITFRGLGAYVCAVRDSGIVLFRDMTVWNGSAFAFHSWQGAGPVSLIRCQVVPGPKPEGVLEERVHSACDASHFSNMRQGPVMEDCVFTDMTDDGTNINGHYAMASGFDPQTRAFAILERYEVSTGTYASQTANIEKGDRIRVLTRDFHLLAETTAEGPVEGGKLTVSDSLELPAGELVLQNLSAQSSGFTVRNCVVERIRSRGLLIKAGDGLIEHCTLKDVRMAGILAEPESLGWPEFGFTSNLTVRNNRFIGTGYANPKNHLFAPIAFCGDCGMTPDTDAQLHRNICIEGNLIENRRNETAIWISYVNGGRVGGNRVDSPEIGGEEDSAAAPIAVDSSTGVEISGNTCTEKSETVGMPVEVLEAVTRIRVGM